MKSSPQTHTKFIFLTCLLFLLGNTYSQSIKTNPSLFGKIVNTKKTNPNNGIIRCATVEYEKFLQEKNPKRLKEDQFEAWISPMVSKYKAMRTSSKTAAPAAIITIPVVVHIIYNGQAIGVAPNITDAQIQSQITVLNQDFRRMSGTNGFNSEPVGADTEIQFELAKQDPNGNPTNGIDRVNLAQNTWSTTEIDAIVKPKTIWDPTQYLNMWSVRFTEGNLLGYAQFPDASGLDGLNTVGGNANSDGVVATYDAFGSSDYEIDPFLLNPNYSLGRTMTHEVGHFLGLRHIWGDGNGDEYADTPVADCEASDYCADTPQAGWEHYECGNFDTCPEPGTDMEENYMDYTSDGCMNIFTIDQKARMTAVMNNSPRRKTLKTSTKNSAIPLFAVDAELKFEINNEIASCSSVANKTEKKVIIFNRGTSRLTRATISYTIDGGVNYINYNWTGNLITNQSATFPITISSAVSGTITISILTANNIADERATNNSATDSFSVKPVASNYAASNYVFTLQQDYFGSETTWNLSNSSGTILYSGGPYEDTYINSTTISATPAVITKNFVLQNNQCYTFTIKDAFGDGICCGGTELNGSGDGFYNLKTADGTIVKSGSENFEIESIAFTTNNTLGNRTFDTSNDILLYPNPTKDVLKIEVLNDLGLLDSYTIYNSLGAKISSKKITNQGDLTINIATLNSGIYFISLEKDSAKKTLQFIKE